MPQYDYACKDCERVFTIRAGMNDSRDDVRCATCNSSHVRRLYSGIMLGKGTRATGNGGGGCGGCSPQGCGCAH